VKKLLLMAGALLPIGLQSLSFEVLTDNEDVRVAKCTIEATEEVGLHRFDNPHIVIGVKGGTIRRLEQDGSTNDVHFPTGRAVHRDADPAGKYNRSVNVSGHEIELIVIELKKDSQ
jgi:hypothetical protein